MVFNVSRNVQNFNLSLANVFTCIKLGDILNDQYAFRHNSPSLSTRVQNFSLETETFSPGCWNFADKTHNCRLVLVNWQGSTKTKNKILFYFFSENSWNEHLIFIDYSKKKLSQFTEIDTLTDLMFKVELCRWRPATDETLQVDVLSLLNFIHLNIPAKTETHSRLIWNMIQRNTAMLTRYCCLSLQLWLHQIKPSS